MSFTFNFPQPPLYLDLMGTCHSETEKPAVLKYDHVVRYHTHVERGLSFIAPEVGLIEYFKDSNQIITLFL